jgi:hypothetical protein
MGLALELLGEHGDLIGPDGEIDQEKLLQVYRQGVRNTLLSVGLAFGLEPVGPSIQRKSGVAPGLAGLLWAESPYEP